MVQLIAARNGVDLQCHRPARARQSMQHLASHAKHVAAIAAEASRQNDAGQRWDGAGSRLPVVD